MRTAPKRPVIVESLRNLAALVGLDQPLVNRKQKRKIDAWVERRTAAVEHVRTEATANGRKPALAQEQKWRDQERHTERVRADRVAWMDRLKTSDQPYLRLCAVIGAANGTSTR